MKVKVLFEDVYKIVAVVDDSDECPAELFLDEGEDSTRSSRMGLYRMLETAAGRGLDDLPSGWTHRVDENEGIYEFIKGSLRLFFFKGENGQIAVCTGGAMKKTKKVDQPSVQRAIKFKNQYKQSIADDKLEEIEP